MCDRFITQVSSSKGSDAHTLALAKDGKVYSWGDGKFVYIFHRSNPTLLETLTWVYF